MQIIIQPTDGIEPLLEGIRNAQTLIEIVIFRLDRLEIEQALVEAAARGVRVHALVTYTNRDDLKEIKKLERRLAERHVMVTRTDEDLVRYHSKVMIVDRRRLFLLTFNFTFLDIHHSRSFGIITDDPTLVAEAARVFETDSSPHINTIPAAEIERFVVSPINSRQRLAEFILDAQRQLLIYDGKLSDAEMIRHIAECARAGVEIKIIGEMSKRIKGVQVRRLPGLRLHAQAIIRDSTAAFVGSQSLRKVELDNRREVGLITDDPEAVKSLKLIFEMDWGDVIN